MKLSVKLQFRLGLLALVRPETIDFGADIAGI